jgi:cation diffusion facilitator family transporter
LVAHGTQDNDLAHCVAKVIAIVERGSDDRRALLQLGFNLGRLSERTGLGREAFWDRWKTAVAEWDRERLLALARELADASSGWARTAGAVGATIPPAERAAKAKPVAEHPNARARRFAATLSVAVGLGMLVTKWLAYTLTGSHAILSDALESIVHVAATAFALISLIVSARPPDEKYPYGYGKIGYFSAGFEGGLIALAALAIFHEAIQGLLHPEPLRRLDLGLLLILAASVVNLVLGLWLIRRGKATQSLILVADGQHVLTDSWTSFGVVAGVALVRWTGWFWLDPVIAIAVGLNIVGTGLGLVRQAYSGLMDRADAALLARIVEALQAGRRPGWLDLHNLRAWQSGDRIFVDCHLVVPPDWTAARLHDALDQVEALLDAMHAGPVETIVHFDPAGPRLSYDAEAPWTVATATRRPVIATFPGVSKGT